MHFVTPQGKTVYLDDEDSHLASKYNWNAYPSGNDRWYVMVQPDGFTVYLHRLVMGDPCGVDIDHVDRDGLNNRRNNLRPATRSQNAANAKVRSDNSSGYKGVCWNKWRGRWMSEIRVDGKKKFLGYFSESEDAARAYDAAALEYFGEYARTNLYPPALVVADY